MEQLYLLGKSIAHSASPAMYNALYAALGLDWHYDAADLASEEEACSLIERRAWLSLNATTPYKPLAFGACDVKAASVRLSGGANMLFVREGKIVGLNTDGVGCVSHMERAGHELAGARVVVCGTGPTSLAILAAAATAGADRLALIGRDRDRTKAVLESFLTRYKELAYASVDLGPVHEGQRSFRDAYEKPSYAFGSYATSTEEIAAADVIVDATPLGMGAGDPLPFPADLLGGQALVYDVVYGHGTSRLLEAAASRGLPVLDGRGMLVCQAVENACVLLDVQAVSRSLSRDGMFALMARAAGFAC